MRNDLVDNIRMNMNSEQIRACIYVRVNDTRTRTLHFTFVEEGKVYDLSDLLFAEIVIMKPDGTETDQSMTRYGNELHYTLRTQDINSPGENRAQVRMTFTDAAVVASPEFIIQVYDKLDPRYESSTNEYTALNQKIALVDQSIDEAEAALEQAQIIEGDLIQLRDDVSDMRDDTFGYKEDAAQSASDALGYKNDASDSALAASGSASSASGSAALAQSWAAGGTGVRVGEDTDNAMYYAGEASQSASDALGYKNDAFNSASDAYGYATSAAGSASDAFGYRNDASGYASTASSEATAASDSATEAESWAVGGTGTRTGEDTNNAKYWAEQSELHAGNLAGLNDVDITAPSNGQTLVYNSTSQKWENDNGHTYTEGDGIDISAQDEISVDTVFTEASTRANIDSGDTFSTILGKIKKFFTDLKTVAFTGSYSDLTGTPSNLAYANVNNGFTANQTIDRADGTTSNPGSSGLTLGNNIPNGTEGNSRASIRMYGNREYYVDVRARSISENRAIDLPDDSGTVALTSDVDKCLKANQTLLTANTSTQFTLAKGEDYLLITLASASDLKSTYIIHVTSGQTPAISWIPLMDASYGTKLSLSSSTNVLTVTSTSTSNAVAFLVRLFDGS